VGLGEIHPLQDKKSLQLLLGALLGVEAHGIRGTRFTHFQRMSRVLQIVFRLIQPLADNGGNLFNLGHT